MNDTLVISAIHIGCRKKVELQTNRTPVFERCFALDSFQNFDQPDSIRDHVRMCELDGETEKWREGA